MNACGCMITTAHTTHILYDIAITIHDSNYTNRLQISSKVEEIQMNLSDKQMSRAYFWWDSREVKTDEKAKH